MSSFDFELENYFSISPVVIIRANKPSATCNKVHREQLKDRLIQRLKDKRKK